MPHLSEDPQATRKPRLRGRMYRRHFHRMLILSLFLAVSLVVIMFVVREPLAREEDLRNMRRLGHEIIRPEGLLPQKEMRELKLTGRAFDPKRVIYQPELIPPDAPPETAIAYLPLRRFRLIQSGYPVLRLDGQVEWRTEEPKFR